MNMQPIFNTSGKLLGHLDVDRCRKARDAWVVDEGSARLLAYAPDEVVKDTVSFFRFPIRTMTFQWGDEKHVVSHIVTADIIPAWVWDVAAIRFRITDWDRG